jgi:molybdopterin-guanine dinucleotide biosynthesis protein A
MGGAKPATPLVGRPLISYPLAALRAVCAPVAVVAKRDSPLPEVGYGVELWREPDEPRHPLAGILEALRRAEGRSVVVLACDLPLVTPDLVRALAAAPGALAVVARAGDDVQPLCARYEPAALESLERFDPSVRLQAAIAALEPAFIEVPAAALLNVNDAEGLAAAERLLTAGPSDG